MQTKSWILLRILLNRFHGTSTKDFLSLLPNEDSKKIMSQEILTNDLDPVFVKPYEFLKNLHYSWVAPHVQQLPQHIQELVVSSLPQPLSGGLKNYLKIKSDQVPLPPRAAHFFVRKLYDQVCDPEILAPAFLPKGSLDFLLDLNRQQLVNLIGFLGLYDLTEEIRHLVDKNSLRSIYSCLEPKEMQFIRTCLSQKPRLLFPKMDLQNWDGNCAKLKNAVHQRGLYRLGNALSVVHPHFYWHLSHKLDTGRTALLDKYYNEKAKPEISSVLILQIIHVINFLKHKSEP